MINKVPAVAPNATPHTAQHFYRLLPRYHLLQPLCVCLCVCVLGGACKHRDYVSGDEHFPNQTLEMLGSKPGGEIKTAAREGRKSEGVALVRMKNGKTRQHKTINQKSAPLWILTPRLT